jgi:AcrR family transcriptional regulator
MHPVRYPRTVTLRDRKRARTRQAIVDAATDLFERDGYETTTIAAIAAAADIGTRTFFSYFTSKDEVLFDEFDGRILAAVDAIAARRPDDGPADVLLRALGDVSAESDDLTGRRAGLRLLLIRTVPAVRGRALSIQLDAQREIARHLADAYDDLTEVTAAALTGAFMGAIAGASQVLLEGADRPADPAAVRAALREATDIALSPWRNSNKSSR